MAKKKNKTGIIGGKKPMSSSELRKFVSDRDYEDYKKAKKKYGDRGQAGQDMIDAEVDRRIKVEERDKEFIYQYGKDAPKARGFGTKEYSNPPRKPRMK